jgi:hypothetical protein
MNVMLNENFNSSTKFQSGIKQTIFFFRFQSLNVQKMMLNNNYDFVFSNLFEIEVKIR